MLQDAVELGVRGKRRCFRRQGVLVVANVAAYAGQAVVFVLLGFPSVSREHRWFLDVEPESVLAARAACAVADGYCVVARVSSCSYLAAIALASCFAFLFYGCHLYNRFARRLWKSKVQKRIVADIFIVTVFCTVCFLLRAVTNLVWTHTVSHLQPCHLVRPHG